VDAGSGPDRDDFGLPPVDIEIPDDARELDADVQAYRRELRALRRKRRSDRLRRPLSRRRRRWSAREGITLPLLACCLMLALITSTLLVMFAADQTGVPAATGGRPAATSQPPVARPQRATAQVGQQLPPADLIVGGGTVPLQQVTADGPSMLALVPPGCGCAPALRQLAAADAAAQVRLYLVGTPGEMNQVSQLATQAGQGPGQVANDKDSVLSRDYRQVGLTALLVRTGGTVTYIARDLTAQGLGPVQAAVQRLGPARAGR
jgi:hypothetical protein